MNRSSPTGLLRWPCGMLPGACAAVLAALAVARISHGLWRLLAVPVAAEGANDLWLRYDEVARWFAGDSIYTLDRLTYPPATYAFLWPLLGWLPFGAARWLWAITSLLLLGALARFSLRTVPRLGLIAVLIPLALTSTGTTLGNGQMTLLVLVPLLVGIERSARQATEAPARVRSDLGNALLMVFALAKPTLSAPFLWIPLLDGFRTRRLRTPLLIAALYTACTILASLAQPGSLPALLRGWLMQVRRLVEETGYANVASLLAGVGRPDLSAAAAVLLFLALGVWLHRQQSKDLPTRLALAAIVARVWTYHRIYDDLVLLLPALALLRAEAPARLLGVVLLALLIAPGDLRLMAPPWGPLYVALQVSVWTAAFVVLSREQQSTPRAT